MDESVMNHLQLAIQSYIERHDMFTSRDFLVVALSGGVDSVALLLSLHALGYRLHAYHLNHGLRGEQADADAAFCRVLCERRGIAITVEGRDVAALAESRGVSFETMGRILRYEGLSRVVCTLQAQYPGCRVVVVTGHHAGDAAETFVMNVLRGAGLDGLTSIQPVTERTVEHRDPETGFHLPPVKLSIARPLLGLSKSELQEYVRVSGESWCEDETNSDLRYLRNKVRHILRDADVKMIGRTIALVSDDRAYIESRIDELEERYFRVLEECEARVDELEWGEEMPLPQAKAKSSCVLLVLGENEDLHPVEFARLVRRAVRKVSGHIVDLSKKDVDAIARLERTGASLEVAGRIQVYRSYEGLEFRSIRDLLPMRGAGSAKKRVSSEEQMRFRREWRNAALIGETEDYRVWAEAMRAYDMRMRTKRSEETAYGWVYYFDADKIVGNFLVRKRKPGDRMVPLGMKGYKKVKDVLIDAKVDARVRDNLALVWDDEKLCLIGGVRMSEEVRIENDTKRLWKVMVERKHVD